MASQCQVSCLAKAFTDSACDGVGPVHCLCLDQSAMAGWQSCVDSNCDAADAASWSQSAIQDCDEAGVTISLAASSTPVPASTEFSTSSTKISTILSTSVVIVSSAPTFIAAPSSVGTSEASTSEESSLTPATSSHTNNVFASTSSANNPYPPSSASASPLVSQASNNGLPTGAKIGIAVGVIVLVLAVVGAFIFWRRINMRKTQPPLETTVVHDVNDGDRDWNAEKEVKAITTTSIVSPEELSNEQATYEKPGSPLNIASKLNPLAPWSSSKLESPHELGTSTAYTELTAVVPSEIATTSPVADHIVGHNRSLIEADSTNFTYNAIPIVSVLGSPSFPDYHELSSSPSMTASSTVRQTSMPAAQELSSSPSPGPMGPHSMLITSQPASEASEARVGKKDSVSMADDGDAEDIELIRMKAEIESIRAEKESVQRLQALEERERVLSRKIVERELRTARS